MSDGNEPPSYQEVTAGNNRPHHRVIYSAVYKWAWHERSCFIVAVGTFCLLYCYIPFGNLYCACASMWFVWMVEHSIMHPHSFFMSCFFVQAMKRCRPSSPGTTKASGGPSLGRYENRCNEDTLHTLCKIPVTVINIMNFLLQVYAILMVQLFVTVAIVGLFTFW